MAFCGVGGHVVVPLTHGDGCGVFQNRSPALRQTKVLPGHVTMTKMAPLSLVLVALLLSETPVLRIL